MHIIVLWKQSLKLCKPSTIKLFTLLTLKTMRDALRILMAWWVMLPIAVVSILYILLLSVFSTLRFPFSLILTIVTLNITQSILNMFFVLLARPSVDYKGFFYFKKNIAKIIRIFVMFWMIWLLFWLVALIVFCDLLLGVWSTNIGSFIGFIGSCFFCFMYCALIIIQTWSILFYLDNTEDIRCSCRKGARMAWDNIPVLVIYGFGFVCMVLILLIVAITTLKYLPSLAECPHFFLLYCAKIFINFVSICLMTNLYVKLAYDDRYALCFSESKPNSEL